MGVMIAATIVAVASGIVGYLALWFGADSRPGFSDGRTDYKTAWFPHSRDDY